MRWMSFVCVALATTIGSAQAVDYTAGMKTGAPEIKAITSLAFGPEGVLFLGDAATGSIFAVATQDTKATSKDPVDVERIDNAIASMLGTTAENITINDVKVNPASGNVFLAVTRKGETGGSLVLKLSREGKITEFKLKNVMFSTVTLKNAKIDRRAEAITSLAYVEGKLIVAGMSNEEFASTLRSIPFPFEKVDNGTSVEIYHGAHGRFETNAPIRTFVPYQISGADYLVAAYTCTPLVRVPVADLKAGTKVKGTTIAELGNRNRPLDMVVYTKDKKDYLLMANSARGVMKISTDGLGETAAITTPVKGGGSEGQKYETIEALKGVMQLDKLDADHALILVQEEDKSYTLRSIDLP